MKLHPFNDTVATAQVWINRGGSVFQQWLCEHCGTKQTMDVENAFYTKGKCEECEQITDIQKNGCNYMVVMRSTMV